MADEINFLDLVALTNITPGLVVEKFGGKINSSFFDGSNILGTLRLKGLVDFTANFPGQSVISITEAGKQLLAEAEERAKAPFDAVDFAIVTQLQGGKRSYVDIGGAVNLRPRDLAMHLYKMGRQQYIVYDIKNGNIDIMLTEKGLLQAKAGFQPAQPAASAPVSQPVARAVGMQPTQGAQQIETPQPPEAQNSQDDQALAELEKKIAHDKKRKKVRIIILIGIVIIIVIVLLLLKNII